MTDPDQAWRDGYDEGWHDGYDEGWLTGRDESNVELEIENARLRNALKRIAAAESGPWGSIANEALRIAPFDSADLGGASTEARAHILASQKEV